MSQDHTTRRSSSAADNSGRRGSDSRVSGSSEARGGSPSSARIRSQAKGKKRKQKKSGAIIGILLFLIIAAALVLLAVWFGLIGPGFSNGVQATPEETPVQEVPVISEVETTAEPEPEPTIEPITEQVYASSYTPVGVIGEYVIAGDYGGVSFRDPTIAVDAAGNMVSVGADGQSVGNVDLGGFVTSLVKLSDGRIGAVSWTDDAQKLSVLNASLDAVADTVSLPASAVCFADGTESYSFYYSNGVDLYGYDLAAKKADIILNWTDVDVSGARVISITTNDGKSFSCLANLWREDQLTYEPNLITISSVPKTSSEEKTQLVLISTNPVDELQDAIVSFNRSSSETRIVLRSFEPAASETDMIAALKKYAQDELNGKMPDLYDLSGMPYESMAASGLLEDLTPYLEKDAELSENLILPQVLSAMKVGGKLYGTASGFTLGTVVGPDRFLGSMTGWTFDQYANMTSTMGSGTYAFGAHDTRESMLYDVLGMNLDRFVNWDSMTCSFSDPGFAKILSFIKTLPAEERDTDDSELIRNKIQLLQRVSLYTAADIANAGIDFAGPVFIGLPVIDGGGNVLTLHRDYAVSSTCADKDSAWQLVRKAFTSSYQEGGWIFPSNTEAFDAHLSAAGEQAELVRSLVNNSAACKEENVIYDLVYENSQGFFTGRESVSTAASAIQTAVSSYLSSLK